MIIHLTQPVCESPIFDRILRLWKRRAVEESPCAQVVVHQTKPYKSHGDLLTGIWRRIVDHPGVDHVISEIDFIPEPGCIENLEKVCAFDSTILCAMPKKNFFTPDPGTVETPENPVPCIWPKKRGGRFSTIGEHESRSAPWLMIFPSRFISSPNLPPENWLDHHPGYDEPALKAYEIGIEGGYFTEDSFLWIKGRDEEMPLRGFHYPGYGIHAFCGRHYADPQDFILPDLGYTVREHLAEIDKILTTYGA